MRAKVIQVVWHNKEPVLSLDFHPSGTLATGGVDGEIKLWRVENDEAGGPGVTFLASITGDKYDTGYQAWNCVRFCPTGQSLAAVGDRGQILVLKPQEQSWTAEELASTSWRANSCGAYSSEDVVDLSWAADGSGFVSASNDMTCMLWEPEARHSKAKLRLEGHQLYVQGVSWDPLHEYVASQSADRTCRLYRARRADREANAEGKLAVNKLDGFHCSHVITKGPPASRQSEDAGKQSKKSTGLHFFHDEGVNTFFRRLSWSPEGSMLVIPAGVRRSPASEQTNLAYIFARGHWESPLVQLPVPSKPSVAVRFCPVLFELESQEETAAVGPQPIDLPYRMVFAIATKDSVLIYETQGLTLLAVLGGLHLDNITDIAWSLDGRLLAVSSYDSYCSLASFEPGELGRPINAHKVPQHINAFLWSSVASKYLDNQKERPGGCARRVGETGESRVWGVEKRNTTSKTEERGAQDAPEHIAQQPKAAPLPKGGVVDSSGVNKLVTPSIAPSADIAGFKRRRITPVAISDAPKGQETDQIRREEKANRAGTTGQIKSLSVQPEESEAQPAEKSSSFDLATLAAMAGKEAATHVRRP